MILQVPQARIDVLAIAYLLARVAYIVCYVMDRANLRTFVRLIGFACTVALFFQI